MGISFAIYSAVALSAATRSAYASTYDLQRSLIPALRAESKDWRNGAQVIIANSMPSKFTNGYPHWSTGFVRHASGWHDVFGMVGAAEGLRHYPFLGEFDLDDTGYGYDSEFWRTVDGDMRRKKLVGLMRTRPIYAYRYAGGALIRSDLHVAVFDHDRHQRYCAAFGEPFLLPDEDVSARSQCETNGREPPQLRLTYWVSDAPPTENFSQIDLIGDGGIDFGTTGSSPVALGPSTVARLNAPIDEIEAISVTFKLIPEQSAYVARSARDDEYPPTPFVWCPVISMEQRGANTYQVALNGEKRAYKVQPDKPISVSLTWRRGEYFAYRINGGPLAYSVTPAAPTGGLTIGRGYRNRTWRGALSDFRGVMTRRDGTQVRLSISDLRLEQARAKDQAADKR